MGNVSKVLRLDITKIGVQAANQWRGKRGPAAEEDDDPRRSDVIERIAARLTKTCVWAADRSKGGLRTRKVVLHSDIEYRRMLAMLLWKGGNWEGDRIRNRPTRCCQSFNEMAQRDQIGPETEDPRQKSNLPMPC